MMILLSKIQMRIVCREYAFLVEGTVSIGASINLLTFTLLMAYTLAMLRCHGLWNVIMLSNEQLSILGYDCQKATCQWRGRTFEAWFTTKIPTRLGPWIFGGLPGLILKIYDKDHLYTWEAVEIKSGNFPIIKSEYKGFVKDTREHIYKLQVAANRDHLKTAGARDYQTGQLKSKPHPYEPLEKE